MSIGTPQVERFGDKVRSMAEMVWTCAGDGLWINWAKDVEYGSAR